MLADEDFWDDILGHLKQSVLVPIIGPELLTTTDGERHITVARLIGESLASRYKLTVQWSNQAVLDDVVRAYVAVNGRDKAERLYRIVNDILSSLTVPPPEPFKQLARITDFRLFVSTTFDSLLARALNEARFGADLTRESWFSPNQSTGEQQKNSRAPGRDEAVVFKLFGEVSSTPQYALHEEDMLEWIHALLTETARLPDWLGYQLKQNPLLFIGCQMSDWMGRFLIRMASTSRLSLTNKQFFIVGSSISGYPGLSQFFATYCGSTRVQVLEVDPSEFVGELYERWAKRNPQAATGRVAAPPAGVASPRGSIFISYVREDAASARRLADVISGLGGDVWFDERRLQPGDRWEEEILASIRREIRLFIPLISKNTEARDEGYVFREWGEAVVRAKGIPRRRFIVPIIVDDDSDKNPARYRQVPNEFLDFHFGSAPGGEPDQKLLAALNEEIRAMRRKDAA
jgi:hypothetical protein